MAGMPAPDWFSAAQMVELKEESSNRLFAVLSDWNTALQACVQGDSLSFDYG